MTFEEWKLSVDRPSCHRDTLRMFFDSGMTVERAHEWFAVNAWERDPDYIEPPKPKRKPGRPQVVFTRAAIERAMLRGALGALVPFQLKKIAAADREWFEATLARMRKVLDQG